MTIYSEDVPTSANVLRAVRSLSGDDGVVLGYHPVARMNPYQALLYCRARSSGFAPVPIPDIEDLNALVAAAQQGVDSLFHLHWTSGVLGGAPDAQTARVRADHFVDLLTSAKEKGVGLVWTVHNALPHGCRYPDEERRMRSMLAELMDLIHVMGDETVAELSSMYQLPEHKTVVVPHPSYVGAYPTDIEREQARFEFGFEREHLIFGAIGSIQPYKGLESLADEVTRLSIDDATVRLLIAGVPGRDDDSKELIARIESSPTVRLLARRLDDRWLTMAVAALDISVLPYRSSLNSGAAMLSISNGVPIIAPYTGGFRSLIDRGLGIGFDPSDTSALGDALISARDFVVGFSRETAMEYAEEMKPPIVSIRFFEQLRMLSI
ncbi:MAG: glycosyltransferase family 4 protein [Acidimicrobiia bacterium]|nr:glycosyltransferase family 4 protein [Acidimicrobiia bacterium]